MDQIRIVGIVYKRNVLMQLKKGLKDIMLSNVLQKISTVFAEWIFNFTEEWDLPAEWN